MKPDQSAEIIRRLRCAAGHLNAVIEMIEADKPCDQVLYQLNAVQSALRATMSKLIVREVQDSQAIILNSRSSMKRVAELKRLQSLYAILIQRSNQHNEVFHD